MQNRIRLKLAVERIIWVLHRRAVGFANKRKASQRPRITAPKITRLNGSDVPLTTG